MDNNSHFKGPEWLKELHDWMHAIMKTPYKDVTEREMALQWRIDNLLHDVGVIYRDYKRYLSEKDE